MKTSPTKSNSYKHTEPVGSSRHSPSQGKSESKVAKFVALVTLGISSWTEAGKMLVDMYAQDEAVFQKITAQCKWLTSDALMTFIRIGRSEIRPEILLLRPQVQEALMRLPYAQQVQVIDSTVPVVTATGAVQHKTATELTAADVRVAIRDNRIASVDAQRRYFKSAPPTAPSRPLLCFKLVLRKSVLVVEPATEGHGQRIWLNRDGNGEMSANIEISEMS